MPIREVDVFGIYVAPIAVLMLAAWLLLTLIHRLADLLGLADKVWHPGLLNAALYVILLSLLVLVLAGRNAT
jgi:protein AaeX